MTENREKLGPREEIVRMRIPKEDRMEWIKTLIKGGYTEEELSRILIHLSEKRPAKDGLEEYKKLFKEEKGREMTPKEEEENKRLFKAFELLKD